MIIYYLENKGVNTKRPFLIIGNYFTNGESISYVNSNISLEAIVRGNIRLISTNPTEDYQEASRSCFKKTKFLEEDPNWTQPTKFIVGPEKYIKNIGEVSAINDKFIDDLGYEGFIGAEYKPENTTEEGLAWIKKYDGLEIA